MDYFDLGDSTPKYESMQSRLSRKKADSPILKRLDDIKDKDKKLKEAANMFEEFFVHSLLKQMRKTLPGDPLLPNSRGREIFQDMLDGHHAGGITKRGGIGLSRFIIEQIKQDGR